MVQSNWQCSHCQGKHFECKQKTHILDVMECSMLSIEMKEYGKEVIKHVSELIDLEKATASRNFASL